MKCLSHCFLLIFFLSAMLVTDAEPCLAASDSLTYLNHSFVKIKTSDGVVIYIDPYAVNAFADSADIVLITHEHSDHNDLTRVKQKSTCTVIRSSTAIVGGVYQSFSIGSVNVKAVAAYNANHQKSSCAGYVVEFNGIKLYHAGDTGNITEMADLDTMDLDYSLLPMEGTYTVTPEVATQMAATINAKHDIPIHTMVPPDTYSDAIVARFLSPNKLVVHPGETISLVHDGTEILPDAPVLAYPVESDSGRRPTFVWYSSPNATQYHLQIAIDDIFSLMVLDTTLADTTLKLSTPLIPNMKHYWRVSAKSAVGEGPFSAAMNFTTGTTGVKITEAGGLPKDFALLQNFPNPFNPTTEIRYLMSQASHVTLKVYDILGRELLTLVNEVKESGIYTMKFNGANLSGGTYFVRMNSGGFSKTIKVMLLK